MFHRFFQFVCFVVSLHCAATNTIVAQTNWQPGIAPLENIEIRIDTSEFSFAKNHILFRGEPHLAFEYVNDEAVVEIRVVVNQQLWKSSYGLNIMPSADFNMLDSLTFFDAGYYKTRLRFNSLSNTDFLNITLAISIDNETTYRSVNLLPYTQTIAQINFGQDDLYVGEEKQIELVTNNIHNLKLDGIWKIQDQIEYRLFKRGESAYLSVLPSKAGRHTIILQPQTKKPYLKNGKIVSFQLDPIVLHFEARESRLGFLRVDKKDLVREQQAVRDGIEVQIDHHRRLQLNKTYRLENSEEKGGPLIAELFTQRLLSNDRVLCIVRPYADHRITDGYLYIKDGDFPMFITNFNIFPEASISRISILREGQDWTESRNIKPGETFDLRIEGEGLHSNRFYFEDLEIIQNDTITANDHTANFKIKVPIDIKRKTVEIYSGSRKMNASLQVTEYRRPRPLDFVTIDYGEGPLPLDTKSETILYGSTVIDIILDFDRNKIDRGDELYGKQFLEVEIRLLSSRNELVEYHKIDLIEVCPGLESPRAAFSHGSKCQLEPIHINNRLTRKTHTLREWSRIEVTVQHKKDRYGGEGYSHRVAIVQQKAATFDIDLSFPAGLVTKRIGESGFPTLSGVSLAMIAQFTFYKKGELRKPKPYKIGGGFLAQNAFNFNPEAENRDLGIVIIGSLYPTNQDARLSFPLYGGGGYFLNQEKFFFLIGPGIRISL